MREVGVVGGRGGEKRNTREGRRRTRGGGHRGQDSGDIPIQALFRGVVTKRGVLLMRQVGDCGERERGREGERERGRERGLPAPPPNRENPQLWHFAERHQFIDLKGERDGDMHEKF